MDELPETISPPPKPNREERESNNVIKARLRQKLAAIVPPSDEEEVIEQIENRQSSKIRDLISANFNEASEQRSTFLPSVKPKLDPRASVESNRPNNQLKKFTVERSVVQEPVQPLPSAEATAQKVDAANETINLKEGSRFEIQLPDEPKTVTSSNPKPKVTFTEPTPLPNKVEINSSILEENVSPEMDAEDMVREAIALKWIRMEAHFREIALQCAEQLTETHDYLNPQNWHLYLSYTTSSSSGFAAYSFARSLAARESEDKELFELRAASIGLSADCLFHAKVKKPFVQVVEAKPKSALDYWKMLKDSIGVGFRSGVHREEVCCEETLEAWFASQELVGMHSRSHPMFGRLLGMQFEAKSRIILAGKMEREVMAKSWEKLTLATFLDIIHLGAIFAGFEYPVFSCILLSNYPPSVLETETLLMVIRDIGEYLLIRHHYSNVFDSSIADPRICSVRSGRLSWPLAVAVEHADVTQLSVLRRCYGSDDPLAVLKVKAVFEDIGVPGKFVEWERAARAHCWRGIQQISEEKLVTALQLFFEEPFLALTHRYSAVLDDIINQYSDEKTVTDSNASFD
ncbi:unnamed protein product [Notodromas monacha]|uniref:Uncharacterized protein n=1 Tax=Notodromas monacha TaxID=399045 RepID=A0A7R9BHJ0_9CRUS|nr:unnamed protein product [Notodromas monacha]CAG0914566.1 unnamed protein product [Notodromas monacha]